MAVTAIRAPAACLPRFFEALSMPLQSVESRGMVAQMPLLRTYIHSDSTCAVRDTQRRGICRERARRNPQFRIAAMVVVVALLAVSVGRAKADVNDEGVRLSGNAGGLDGNPPLVSRTEDMTGVPLSLVHQYGFEAGGRYSLAAEVAFDGVTREEIGNRTMNYLMRCDLADYNRVTVRDTAGDVMFCDGVYLNPSVCDAVPFDNGRWEFESPDAKRGRYITSVATEGVVDERILYFYFISSCEMLGSSEALLTWGSAQECMAQQNAMPGVPVEDLPACHYPSLADRTTQTSYVFTFQNPDGFLSYTQELLLPIYSIAMIVWAVLAVAWVVNTWRARNAQPVDLHWRMLNVPIVKLISVSVDYAMWQVRDNGAPATLYDDTLLPVSVIARVVFLGVFFEVLVLISKGWCTTRARLLAAERRNVYMILLFFVVGKVAFNLWGSLFGSVALLTALVLTVTYIVLLYIIWFATVSNKNALVFQLEMARRYRIDQRRLALWTRYTMFRSLRNSYLGYLVFKSLSDVLSWNPIFVRTSPWVPVLLDEGVEAVFYASVMHIFRARFMRAPAPPVEEAAPGSDGAAAPVDSADAASHGSSGGGADGEATDPEGSPLPRIVVVEHPGKRYHIGRPVDATGVAEADGAAFGRPRRVADGRSVIPSNDAADDESLDPDDPDDAAFRAELAAALEASRAETEAAASGSDNVLDMFAPPSAAGEPAVAGEHSLARGVAVDIRNIGDDEGREQSSPYPELDMPEGDAASLRLEIGGAASASDVVPVMTPAGSTAPAS